MKIVSSIVFVTGAAALLLFSGCTKAIQQKIEKAKEDAQSEQQEQVQADKDAKSDYLDEWQAFRSEALTQITANAVMMDDLKAKTAKSSEDVKVRVNASIESLSKQNLALKAKLDGYKDEGLLSWDAFRRDFSQQLSSLDKSLAELKADNRN